MISRTVRLVVVLMAAFFTACGDDGTGPGSDDGTDPASNDSAPPGIGWETLLGPYAGAFTSVSQGVAFAADLDVTFSQSSGRISGAFAINGVLTAGMDMLPIRGTGSFTGTIDRGLDPSVNITFVNACPGYSAHYSGALESETRLLTISGPAHILVNCVVVLTFDTTILMDPIVLLEDGAIPAPST